MGRLRKRHGWLEARCWPVAVLFFATVAKALPEPTEKSRWVEPASVGPNYLAAAAELGILLGGGSTWYALDPATNAQDWVYDYSWATLKKKLITGEAIQTDANPFYLNSPGHPVAGTAYYLIARYNHFPAWASFLIANFASLAWELATEFREEMSINDILMTPVGGFALGESIYILTKFLEQARPGSLPSQPLTTARLLDGRGYPFDTWYRYGFSVGGEGHRSSPVFTFCSHIGFDATLLKSAAYDRPGIETWSTRSPFATRLNLRLNVGERGVDEGRIRAEVAYAGVYGQRLEAHGGGVTGVAGYLSMSALFHHQEEHPVGFDDQLGAVALFGIEGHGVVHFGLIRLRVGGQLHPVFAGVRSLAWAEIASRLPEGERAAPSVLRKWNYYWAAGLGLGGQLSLEYDNRTWLGWEYRRYQLSPAEDWVGRPHPGADRDDVRVVQTLSVTQALPWSQVWGRALVERVWRDSTYGGIGVSHEDFRAQLAIVWGASR